MTLTAPRRVRGGTRLRPAERQVQVPLEPPVVRPDPIATLALPDVFRVSLDEVCIGYIQIAGPVYVALRGAVYNTSLEFGQ